MSFFARAICLMAVLLATTWVAQAADVLKKFDQKTIEAVLSAVGASDISKDGSGQDTVTLFTVGGLKYTTMARACKADTGCLGLLVQCVFSTDATFPTATTNTFNLGHVFTVTALSTDRKTIYMARYLIADGGTTLGNTIENFKVFFALPPLMLEQIRKDESTPVASAQPSAAPAAASLLASTAVAASSGSDAAAAEVEPAAPGPWILNDAQVNRINH